MTDLMLSTVEVRRRNDVLMWLHAERVWRESQRREDAVWDAVANVATLEAVSEAVRAPDPDWQVCELLNRSVRAALKVMRVES